MTGRLTIREDAPSGMAWTVIYGFLARVGVVVSAVGLTAALLTVWRFGDQYRPGFLPIAVLLLIVGVVWSWWDVARGRPGQNGLKFYVVAATVLFALHPWMWTGDPVNGYPTPELLT